MVRAFFCAAAAEFRECWDFCAKQEECGREKKHFVQLFIVSEKSFFGIFRWRVCENFRRAVACTIYFFLSAADAN